VNLSDIRPGRRRGAFIALTADRDPRADEGDRDNRRCDDRLDCAPASALRKGGPAGSTATSGTSAWFRSLRACGRRCSSRCAFTSIRRAYASRESGLILGHVRYIRRRTV
jgi:hypothetical protein